MESFQLNEIQISGRLNGAEIARTEWYREGISFSDLYDFKISYVSTSAFLECMIIGIKLWIFKGEKLN